MSENHNEQMWRCGRARAFKVEEWEYPPHWTPRPTTRMVVEMVACACLRLSSLYARDSIERTQQFYSAHEKGDTTWVCRSGHQT